MRVKNKIVYSLIIILFFLACPTANRSYTTSSLREIYGTTLFLQKLSPEYDTTGYIVDLASNNPLLRARAILEQKYEFNPPVKILLVFAPKPAFYSWEFYYPPSQDSFNLMMHQTMKSKLGNTELVDDVILGSQLFNFRTVPELQELGARYQADLCLLVSYKLFTTKPTSCLGFWTVNYMVGDFSSEYMFVDTRTGFIIISDQFSHSDRSSSNLMFDRDRTRELMGIFADKFADKIKESLTDFYQKQMEIKK
jgi:hypothetical protein